MARHLDELTHSGAPWGKCPDIDPAAVLRRVEEAMEPALPEWRPNMTKRLRFPFALAAALLILIGSALALAPTLRELIAANLGPRASYAAEVLGSCEDLGVTIEAKSALTDNRMTRLYFTVQDPTGVFFLEDTQNDLYMNFLTGEEEIYGNAGRREDGLELLFLDPETQTGLYVFRMGPVGYESTTPPTLTHAKLTMSYFIPGYRFSHIHFCGPGCEEHPTPTDILASTSENGAVVLLPNQNPQPIDEDYPEMSISSMGYASDGCYHIRIHQEPGIVQAWSCLSDPTPFEILYVLADPEYPEKNYQQYGEEMGVIITPVSDGWDYCLSFLTPESYEELKVISFYGSYSVSGGYRTGNWELTVPLQSLEARTVIPEEPLILSRTKDSPPPSGESHEAQVASVSVSSLSVVADFTCPENYHLCADVDGYETECTVTLTDGTILTPAFFREAWSNSGWVMWEFPEPIDPGQVVSVSLNGNEIPLGA